MDKNPKVKAGHLKSETFRAASEKEESRKSAEKTLNLGKFTMLTDVLAKDKFHMKNQPIPKGKEHFPTEWRMQYTDLYYPYARLDDGAISPLWIDQPATEFDVKLCQRKKVVMNKLGLRYTYLEPGKGEPEARAILDDTNVEEQSK